MKNNVTDMVVLEPGPGLKKVLLPGEAEVLGCFGREDASFGVWFRGDPEGKVALRYFMIVPTGERFLANVKKYLGSVQFTFEAPSNIVLPKHANLPPGVKPTITIILHCFEVEEILNQVVLAKP